MICFRTSEEIIKYSGIYLINNKTNNNYYNFVTF